MSVDLTADCVLTVGDGELFDGHQFAGVVFLGEGAEFYGCRFTNCDLSALTRATLIGNDLIGCAMFPMKYL